MVHQVESLPHGRQGLIALLQSQMQGCNPEVSGSQIGLEGRVFTVLLKKIRVVAEGGLEQFLAQWLVRGNVDQFGFAYLDERFIERLVGLACAGLGDLPLVRFADLRPPARTACQALVTTPPTRRKAKAAISSRDILYLPASFLSRYVADGGQASIASPSR